MNSAQSWALISLPLSGQVLGTSLSWRRVKDSGDVMDPINPSLSSVPVWASFVTAAYDSSLSHHGGLKPDDVTRREPLYILFLLFSLLFWILTLGMKKTHLIALQGLSLRSVLESWGCNSPVSVSCIFQMVWRGYQKKNRIPNQKFETLRRKKK